MNWAKTQIKNHSCTEIILGNNELLANAPALKRSLEFRTAMVLYLRENCCGPNQHKMYPEIDQE